MEQIQQISLLLHVYVSLRNLSNFRLCNFCQFTEYVPFPLAHRDCSIWSGWKTMTQRSPWRIETCYMCDSLNRKGLDNKECPDSWDCAQTKNQTPHGIQTQTRHRPRPISIHISRARNCCAFVWLFTPTLLASLPSSAGWERDKRTLRADQLSRDRSRNESLSNKQSTWWSGRTGQRRMPEKKNRKNMQKEARIYTRAINLYEEQWIYAWARLLLFGACRQSKIINTPNFEKWLKKKFVTPPPLPTHWPLGRVEHVSTASH